MRVHDRWDVRIFVVFLVEIPAHLPELPLQLGDDLRILGVWGYCPVMILTRDGVQIELLQKQFSKRMPSRANRSIFGVGFNAASRLPYTPKAWVVWSSDMTNRILGRDWNRGTPRP